jgi:glycosyltransferase involved in cell wall biosynthesis
VGVGRSYAVIGALAKIGGVDPREILARGTHNRKLYKELLIEADVIPEAEPLISIAARVKYAPDRLRLLILSMQRQRHENWELIAVTDGPDEGAVRLIAEVNDARIHLIETEQPRGRWGHPYRQRGLDACRGTYIGMTNDDNYYVRGDLEQMLNAITNAEIAVCQILHSYASWGVAAAGSDLGAWIARASLVRQVPWTGEDFDSDQHYLKSLMARAVGRVAVVNRPLFVHN